MKEVRETQLEFKHEIREVTASMANLDAKVGGHQWKIQEIILISLPWVIRSLLSLLNLVVLVLFRLM